MKKTTFIFITALITVVLTLMSCSKHTNPETVQVETPQVEMASFQPAVFDMMPNDTKLELVYNVDTRFIHKVTLENLLSATSIVDVLPKEATDPIEEYQEMNVIILNKNDDFRSDDNLREENRGSTFSTAQRELLKTVDYSTNMVVEANYKIKNTYNDELVDRYLSYHMTIIPTKQAEFVEGREAFIEFIKEETKAQTYLIKEDQLKPGRVHFTVTPTGEIVNTKISSTSGYPSIDKTLVDLISNMSGQWVPATNAKGENVSQELVFFFGQQGC